MTVIKVENLSKQYRLGLVNSKTIAADFHKFMAKIRGKEDPTLIVGVENRLDTVNGEYIWALKDINFEVKEGEVLGIIGKNGAGKSTLLKILSKVTTPTTGNIKIKGRIASLLEVGTGFHPELTGRENIFLNGAILGMTKAEIRRKFDEIVDFSGVGKYVDTPVKRYSSGMYVRLAFAVAAHLEPEILIVDEVLAVGDAEFQKKALGKMKDISSGQGRTVLFVSHNMTAIQSLCNRCVLLSNGLIKANGDTANVINKYLSISSAANSKNLWNDIKSAPGNDFIRVRRTNIINHDSDNNDSIIYVSTRIKIEIEFWNLMENYINVSLHLFSLNGNCIFNVSTQSEKLEKGLYKAICYIPENFLNDDKYYISNMYVKDSSTSLFFHEEAAFFDVHDESRENSAWFGKWLGAVRPSFLQWDYFKIEE